MFAEIWKTFMAAPSVLGPTPGERERRHCSRPRYAVWLIRVSSPDVRARAHLAAAALAALLPIAPLSAEPVDLDATRDMAGFRTLRAVTLAPEAS